MVGATVIAINEVFCFFSHGNAVEVISNQSDFDLALTLFALHLINKSRRKTKGLFSHTSDCQGTVNAACYKTTRNA
jgi:hypothetical protein